MDQIAMTIGYFVLICGLGALAFGVLSFVAYLILLAWEAFSYRFRATLKAEKQSMSSEKTGRSSWSGRSRMMETELKPCPFCGGEAKIRDFSIPDLDPEIAVFCTNCGGQTFVYETVEEAIEAWNRRAEGVR